jgi:hypothetical protein
MMLISSASLAQVRSSQPTPEGGRLAAVLLFIQEGLNKTGKMDFQVVVNDRTLHVVSETSGVSASVDRCGIQYHSSYSVNGNVLNNKSSYISFRDIQTLTVLTAEQDFQQINPTFDGKVRPQVFFLRVQEKGTDIHRSPEFVFPDGPTAESIKRAMIQATTLCTRVIQ